jgi:aminopeptidase N
MKKYFLTLIIFSFAVNCISAQEGTDYCSQGKIKAFVRLNKTSQNLYPGDSNIDVTYYKLNLTVTTNPNYLSGVVTVKARSAKSSINSFYLDLVNALQVTSVKLGTASLTYSQPQNSNQLQINFNKSYALGEEFSVDIAYGGIPTSGSGSISSASFLFVDKNSNNKAVVASLSEPYGARDWWPSKDTPADKADSSDVWITADKFFVSVSNGSLTGTVDNPDGTRTYKWKNHYPIANYLISVAMTNYQTITDQFEYEPGKFLPLIHYCYPERINTARQNAVLLTNGMLQIYSQKFGPYPYLKEKYGHAEFSWGGGMEHQTVTSMGGGAMSSENTIAHELGHQWYGDKVTCKDWQNIWLNEGFASYCECVYREGKYGTADFKNYINNFMNQAKSAVGTIYVQNISSENEIFNSARSYKKGAIVLHMLRGIVGDDKFFQIMREFANEPGLAYNVATTEDFQRIAERVYGSSLNYFFKEWIYGDSYPKYTIGWTTNLIGGNNYNLHLRAMQNTNLSNNPAFFTMPLQVKYVTPLETKTITVFNNVQDQGWDITVNGQPTSVTFDPDNWLLEDIVGTTFAEDGKEIPTLFSLSQNYPNPFNPETVINYQLAVSSYVTLKVYDPLGREVATLVDEYQQAGIHNSTFSILNLPGGRPAQHSQLPSGAYFYTLHAGDFVETKKMILLK